MVTRFMLPLMTALPIGETGSLRPGGVGAREVDFLWNVLLWTATAVFIAVIVGLILALRRARQNEGVLPEAPLSVPDRGGRAVLWLGGVLPAVILTVIFAFAVRALVILAGPPAREEALTIQVIGHQYWWEFRYLRPHEDAAVVSANELQLPLNERVRLELTSSDVIHSFWVPSLQGKVDAIPGQVNEFWIQADKEGLYRGLCAEFCGAQHANMHLLLRAVPVTDFDTWLAGQAGSASEAPISEAAQRGRQLFTQRGCAACHSVRGVTARSNLGPDLTHFAARETLGAGFRVNNRGNLAGWVMNAQAIKPGVLMPPSDLNGQELSDMLDYLETLR